MLEYSGLVLAEADPLENQGICRQGKEERCRALNVSATYLAHHDRGNGPESQ